ncbi:type II toxin-antitoxin system HigB family toxin [Fibrella sp. HMF5335]|uniref:Type II toxin-antitoxin system HigB family toxin n=1 Tax=Fibrella rubiginis TaxID=2817060 RepID=A0A939K1V1_9BACT|nr:type II toxin-antitoxin system HigB family toxin [Fibrella rubiginis]MBO0937537.1 type II toxin-antitoxin system HigB family toxin [Fibrella rubiginis]
MVVISKTTLNEFGKNNPDVASALNDWYTIVRAANWRAFADIKQTFNSVDYVGDNRYVFNIKGNQYRLVALVFFSVRTVYIKFIGTHSAYDRIDVTTIDSK